MSTDPTSATRDAPNRTPTDEPRAGQPATRTDPWAAEGTDRFATARAPRTFDPFCTHRLRNTCDDANAAQLRER